MTILQTLTGNVHDLGGFSVARVLPQSARRHVGPFVFFDHLGLAAFPAGKGIDVRPHPHIGLATVTYLFEGGLGHRDSLGTVVDIAPGAVNWMTAGRGIVHSERTPPGLRASGHRMHGIQSWVALPAAHAEVEPSFAHHPGDSLPSITFDGARRTLIAGSAFHATSPVNALSPMFYVDIEAEVGARVELPTEHQERGVYIVSGAIELNGTRHEAGQMLVFAPGEPIAFTTPGPARAMLLGGAPIDPVHIFWNFVSTSPDRIETAKADWRAGRFPPVPGETEFIPLPDDAPAARRFQRAARPANIAPMFIRLTDAVAVAGQLTPADMAAAAAAGYVAVVNNRPDHEAPGQPVGTDIAAAAAAAGLRYTAIPVGAAGLGPAQVAAMAVVLTDNDGPVLAFCRSGTRSTHLWALAAAQRGGDPTAIISAAASGGYEIAGLRTALEQLSGER